MSKFKTKARTIELLGRKQIRDSVTALAELMKNSYLKVNGRRSYRMKKNISTDDKLRLARVLSEAEYEEEKVLIYKVPISYHFYK